MPRRLPATALAIAACVLLGSGAARAAPSAASGKSLYVRYCASCHGVTGAGDGPVARVLETPPSDLQRLGERYGRPLPKDRILAHIDGRKEVPAHGDREMPVWGRVFYFDMKGGEFSPGEREIQEVLQSIFLYLESIQPGGANAPRSDL